MLKIISNMVKDEMKEENNANDQNEDDG